jgi:fructokinase
LTVGLTSSARLLSLRRAAVQSLLNGYVQVDQILTDHIDDYIVSSEFGNDAGLIGALALGQFALETAKAPQSKL